MSDRTKLEIFDNIASKSTYRVSPKDFTLYHLGAMRSPDARCLKLMDGTDMATAAKETYVGVESIQGIEAVRVVRHDPETISWYSPQYGCALIAEEVR